MITAAVAAVVAAAIQRNDHCTAFCRLLVRGLSILSFFLD